MRQSNIFNYRRLKLFLNNNVIQTICLMNSGFKFFCGSSHALLPSFPFAEYVKVVESGIFMKMEIRGEKHHEFKFNYSAAYVFAIHFGDGNRAAAGQFANRLRGGEEFGRCP